MRINVGYCGQFYVLCSKLGSSGLYCLLVSVPSLIGCASLLGTIPVPVFMSTGEAAIKRFDTNFILSSSSFTKKTALLPLDTAPSVDSTPRQSTPLTAPLGQDPTPPVAGTNSRDKHRTSKKYPTACELYKEYPQNTLQIYQTAGDFSNTCFFLVKGGWLNVADLFAVSLAYPDLQDMIESVPDLLQLDFSSLRDPVLDYATQTLIEPSRGQLMTACAVHYNLNIGLVVRYLGGEYTASWRSVTDILNAAAPYVTEEVEEVMTTLSHSKSMC